MEKAVVAELLGDEEFYRTCPIFLFLKETAIPAYQMYLQKMRGQLSPEHDPCLGCSDYAIIKPQITVFVNNIRQHLDNNPEVLEGVKDYIGTKIGRRPEQIVVYYKQNNKPTPVQF